MTKKKYYSYICIILLTVVSLSLVWEFWLETLVQVFLREDFKPESLEERWEYIITISFFICLALIYPVIMGGKLIAKQDKYYDEIKRLSERDYLTGLYNRRKISEDLVREASRSKRYGHTFSTILLDIDCFKETNDEFGHTAGDELLVKISEVIENAVRTSDIVGRWGGDEFLILCPETNSDGAYFLAKKLRKIVEGHKFGIGHKTVSVGVSEYESNDDVESIVVKADKALHLAKQQGKNQVVRTAYACSSAQHY